MSYDSVTLQALGNNCHRVKEMATWNRKKRNRQVVQINRKWEDGRQGGICGAGPGPGRHVRQILAPARKEGIVQHRHMAIGLESLLM